MSSSDASRKAVALAIGLALIAVGAVIAAFSVFGDDSSAPGPRPSQSPPATCSPFAVDCHTGGSTGSSGGTEPTPPPTPRPPVPGDDCLPDFSGEPQHAPDGEIVEPVDPSALPPCGASTGTTSGGITGSISGGA
ncbi:hypothetical protein ACFYZ9_33765 [Streptomyces sp. NPDC001691]|uniref:hypothetical protein n=1 Tax=Streptomyces sp. NPDC001691 TaxID=3364600 RepID=UPI0036BA5D33